MSFTKQRPLILCLLMMFASGTMRAEDKKSIADQGRNETEYNDNSDVYEHRADGLEFPGHPMLKFEDVKKELGLTLEQREKLQGIAEKIAATLKNEPKVDPTKYRELKPEEQRRVDWESVQRYTKRVEATTRLLEQVLTPKQFEQLKDIELRERITSLLYEPEVLRRLGMTDEQEQQMQKLRTELQNEMTRVVRENRAKTLRVLTPDQIKKLKAMAQ